MHLYSPPCFSWIDLIVKSYVPVGSVVRSYLLGLTTTARNVIVNVCVSPVGLWICSQLSSVPAHLSETLLPTNTATFSGLFVNCPHTTATNHNVYTIACHYLNIRFVTLTVATQKLHRAESVKHFQINVLICAKYVI